MRRFFFLIYMLLLSPAFAVGSWKTVADIPAVLPSAEAVVIGQQVYVLSGSVGHGLRHFFEAYDPVDDGWRPLTPFPADISDFAATNIGGRILVVGGRDRQNGNVSSAVWLYVPFSALWVELSPLPEAMIGHSIVAIGEVIYLAGNNKLWRMDGAQGSWRVVGDLPISGSAVQMVENGKTLFLVGGQNRPRVWRYTIDAGTWSSLPDLTKAAAGGGLAVVDQGAGAQLHYIGGYDADEKAASDGHFVFQNGTWVTAPNLPQGRHRMAIAVVDQNLYVIGGAAGDGFFRFFTGSDQLFVFQPSAQ